MGSGGRALLLPLPPDTLHGQDFSTSFSQQAEEATQAFRKQFTWLISTDIENALLRSHMRGAPLCCQPFALVPPGSAQFPLPVLSSLLP